VNEGGIQLSLALLDRHPDAAAAVLEAQSAHCVAAFLEHIPARLGGPVLARMMPFHTARCLLELPTDTAIALLREMPAALAATALRQWPAQRRDPLLEALPLRLGWTLRLLLGYPQTTVGAWMDPEPPLLPPEIDAAEALRRLREEARDLDRVVFVVDREQRLQGRVRLAELLRAAPATPLGTLLDPDGPHLAARSDLLSCRDHPAWQSHEALPVLALDGRLVGVLHHDELRRALSAERGGPHAGRGRLEMADGYWLGLAGLVEGLTRLLPPAAAPRRGPGETP
jgi:magnesium transporter